MKLRFSVSILGLLLLLCASCHHPRKAAATSTPTSGPADARAVAAGEVAGQLDGHWTGDAKVIVQWAKQKALHVDLVIAPDGDVTGKVGDARLVEARLRTQAIGSPLRIHGKLEGNLVDAEEIRRDAVDILLHRGPGGTLSGGLHSSGWEIGGRDSMKLSADGMVLRRVEPNAAHATMTPSTRAGVAGQ